MPERYFKGSWLFKVRDFVLSGSERFKGKYKGVSFELSNVIASSVSTNDDNEEVAGGTVFNGVVFACGFNKKLKYRTVILPDTTEEKYGALIGRWLQKKRRRKMKLMNMDYPEFEKCFKVYGEDEIETHYVLNHHLMKNILELRERLGDEEMMFSFYLKNFVVFSQNFYSFSPPDAAYLQNFKHIKYDFEVIKFYISIIEDLKLNEKLWEV